MKELRSTSRTIGRTAGLLLWFSLLFPSLGHSQETPTPAILPPSPSNKPIEASSKPAKEDWTRLLLDRSALPLQVPYLADTGEIKEGGFIRERFTVNWRKGDPFDLYVIRPVGVKKPPVIIYLYSFPDDTDLIKTNRWAENATSGGYAAVAFVSALTGHRLRYRDSKESLVAEMPEALAESTHDVQLILDFLNTRGDLDTSRIGMFGAGSGASIAILASAVDPRIHAVDLLAPWGDWSAWFANSKIIDEKLRPDFLKPDYLAQLSTLDPVVWLPKMKATAVRLQDIRKNKSMPDENQEKLEAAAPDFALVNAYGNGHAFLTLQPPLLTFDWLKGQLKTDAKTVVAKDKSERIHFLPALENNPAPANPTVPASSAQPDKSKPSGVTSN